MANPLNDLELYARIILLLYLLFVVAVCFVIAVFIVPMLIWAACQLPRLPDLIAWWWEFWRSQL